MAYKFQRGTAILSGALDQEGDILVKAPNAAGAVAINLGAYTGIISGSGNATLNGDIVLGGTTRITKAGAATLLATTTTTLGATALASLDGGINVNDDFTVDADGIVSGSKLDLITHLSAAAGRFYVHPNGSVTALAQISTPAVVSASSGLVTNGSLTMGGTTRITNAGAATLTATTTTTLGASGLASLDGGIAVDSDKFTVSAAGAIAVETDKFTVSAAGAVVAASTISGTLGISGLSGDFEKNVDVGGNLEVVGSVVNMNGFGSSSFGGAFNIVGRDGAGDLKVRSVTDFISDIAGAGISATAGVLSVEGGAATELVDTPVGGTPLAEGNNFATGTAGGTVFLPSPEAASGAPDAGSLFRIKNGASGVLTITRSGSAKIDNETSIVLESPYAAVTVVYMSGSGFGEEYAIV